MSYATLRHTVLLATARQDAHFGREAFFSCVAVANVRVPDQEHTSKQVADKAEAEMAQHFRLCDADGDGYITFSQFLRWVELCDLNPEDHLQVHTLELG